MSSSLGSAQTILYVAHIYVEYVYTAVFIIGIVGNLSNIVIFIGLKKFRQCPSTFYIITESIADIAVLLVGLMARILLEIFNFDPTRTLILWCKLRVPMNQWCTLMVLSAVNFAVFDQYLSTSYNSRLRELSTIKLAKYLICIALITWFFYNIPFVIFYDVQVSFGCLLENIELSRYYSYFHLLVLYGLLPMFFTMTFCILSYRNVRRIHRLQVSHVRRRLDQQLTAMILARVIFMNLFLIPFIAQRFYIVNVTTDPTNIFRIAIEQLIGAINVSLSYLNVSVCLLLFL